MSFTRRALVTAAAAAPVLAGAAKAATATPALPAKSAFAKMPYAYLDSGSTHPMPLGARTALEEYLRYKTRDGTTPGYDMDKKEAAVMARFAALIGADPSELCFIQSTTMGENLVLKAMGYPQTSGRIVRSTLRTSSGPSIPMKLAELVADIGQPCPSGKAQASYRGGHGRGRERQDQAGGGERRLHRHRLPA